MATLTDPTENYLTASKIKDMMVSLSAQQSIPQYTYTIPSGTTTNFTSAQAGFTYVDGSSVAAGEDPSCYELECQIENIQKTLDNRSTILLI